MNRSKRVKCLNEHLKLNEHPEKMYREQDIHVKERILKGRDQRETLKGKNLRTEREY